MNKIKLQRTCPKCGCDQCDIEFVSLSDLIKTNCPICGYRFMQDPLDKVKKENIELLKEDK